MKKTLALALVLAAVAAFAQQASRPQGILNRFGGGARGGVPSGAAAAPKEASTGGTVSIEFNQTPVDLVLEVYGNLVNKTVIKDPGAPSPTITLKPKVGQKLTQEEKIEAIELVMEMNGIHFEQYGEKFVRALPRAKVRREGIPLIMDPETELKESGRVVSMMIPFKNISAQDEAQKALEGFKSDSGILLVFERTNSILVTDTEQNIKRMLEIAKSIDVATPVLENVFVRQIEHAAATDVKTALETIVQESQKELEKAGSGVKNNAAATASAAPPPVGINRLLRPGAKSSQPQTVNNQSLVMSVSDADRGMIRGKVLILADERSNKLIIVTQQSNMDFFDKVIKQLDVETTPDTQVKVYRLKYAEAEEVSDMINDLIGNASSGKTTGNQNQNAKAGSGGNLTRSATAANAPRKGANQKKGEAKAGELSKENTVVLADKRINGIVVMTQKELVPVVEQIIESMDVKLSQVLIETVIVEVGLGDNLDTGVNWTMLGNKQQQQVGEQKVWERMTDENGYPLFFTDADHSGTTTDWKDAADNPLEAAYHLVTKPVYDFTRSGFWNGGRGLESMLGGGGGGTGSSLLQQMLSVGTNAVTTLSPIGSGLNWFFKSDSLNLGAIIQAAKSDSHSKYLASPVVMTVDNKEATIEATEMRYMFKGYQYSGSSMYGSPVPDYEQKELGITIKMTPKINPNGTIMLTVETEYSQEGVKQTIEGADSQGNKTSFDAATSVTRKMSADLLLENMQTAILGGLTKTYYSESESGIPILKDLPFVGKWLFGSVSQKETRSELLIFMQPYVLDDGEAAQAEAIRRKHSLSIARPWEDHGWSLSELADPVSEKERLRRLKELWAKQDEDRKTKLAIEQEKVKRAKALEKMSKEERDFWIEMHKGEIEEEEKQTQFERQVEAMKQDDLRKLAADIRSRKLKEANAAIKEADAKAQAANARGQLEAEKRGETETAGGDADEDLPIGLDGSASAGSDGGTAQ